MGFRRIDCFLAVARLKSFSAAAKYLYLSQSAISQQIAAFEAELGFPLFEREGGHIALTAAGAYLFPRLSSLKATYIDLIDHAHTLAKSGKEIFCIGFDGPLGSEWIGEALHVMAEKYPFNSSPMLYRENLSTLTERLVDGTIDVAVTTDLEIEKLDSVLFTPLLTASPCVYFPEGHIFERMKYVTLQDLKNEHVLGAYGSRSNDTLSPTGRHLRDIGISSDSLSRYPDADTTFLAVGAGFGVFLASHLCDQFAAHYHVKSVELECPLPQVTLGIARRIDTVRSQAFIEAAQQIVQCGGA